MRTTPLATAHQELGARMVPFAGWSMPVQYQGILEEVRTVRHKAGLFDLGHMGRVRITGNDAEAFLQRLQTNNAAAIKPGRIRYAMILDEAGNTQDDVLVYRQEDDQGFFLVINAGNAERDLRIMGEVAAGFADVTVHDQTEDLGMIALQGPSSETVLQRLCGADLTQLKYYAWTATEVAGEACEVSRTGYTGEDGFEIYMPREHARMMWDLLLQDGAQDGLAPIGLGARDTLRLEAGMALYGHEIDEHTNPLEVGLGWAVKFDHDFIGKAALERIRDAGPTRALVGLTTDAKRIPRQGYELYRGDEPIGTVCSGAASPTLGTNIATAHVAATAAAPGTELQFAVRDKREPCTVVELPFYKRPK